jgi:hypothetical protein
MRRQIILLTGLAGAGKTTIAKELVVRDGFSRYAYAEPIKRMMLALGLTWEQVYGTEKETPCELLGGRTPRYAMQTLGTEWGRELISPDIWINAWKARVLADGYNLIVSDDCRFQNEVDVARSIGDVRVVRLNRVGAGAKGGAAGHASELAFAEPDFNVLNNGSVADTASKIMKWVAQYDIAA